MDTYDNVFPNTIFSTNIFSTKPEKKNDTGSKLINNNKD